MLRNTIEISISVLAIMLLCGCNYHCVSNERSNYISHQLIPDLRFEDGICIQSQKDHLNNDEVKCLAFHDFYGKDVTSPKWKLAQWDSGPCIFANLKPGDPSEITDGISKLFRYDVESNKMTFWLDTSAYYKGNAAKVGDYWPHLLIEQDNFGYDMLSAEDKPFYDCSADKLILTMDLHLGNYSSTYNSGDWVEASQFLLFLYVKGKKTNDFCWFGIQLFDNRFELHDHYVGYDGGKADASGAMIYSIGSKYVYNGNTLWKDGKPWANGKDVHVEIDIKPFLEDMFKRGKSDNYFKANDISELCINGMNMGWETIATFNNTMMISNLALTSYINKSCDTSKSVGF